MRQRQSVARAIFILEMHTKKAEHGFMQYSQNLYNCIVAVL